MVLAKSDMETMANDLRRQLGLSEKDVLDPFRISISGIYYINIDQIIGLGEKFKKHLKGEGAKNWSAMSVPLDPSQEKWVIVYNNENDLQRQKVSLLEELWHIIQGHRLTSIVKFGDYYGRSFEGEEEHDAYYLAAATLVPKDSLRNRVKSGDSSESIGQHYGVSKNLVEYRIKRLGLWYEYKGKTIQLKSN